MRSRPGLLGFRISATDAAGIDWPGLASTWVLAGELGIFDAGWTSDHLSDANREQGGASYESFTLLAALAGRVPGMWVGVAVASATFRHPALVAKAATVLDHVTGGRFILGLGAGWHVGEHAAFGIPLPPLRRSELPLMHRRQAARSDKTSRPENAPGGSPVATERRSG